MHTMQEAEKLTACLGQFDRSLETLERAYKQGISKEAYLADSLQEAAIGMSAEQYHEALKGLDEVLYQQNQELELELSQSSGGHIMIDDEEDHSCEANGMEETVKPQDAGKNPNDYYYSTKEYARSVGKGACALALQMAAVTTGTDMVSEEMKAGAKDNSDGALLEGEKDEGHTFVAAGTLYTQVRRGLLSFLPKHLSCSYIAGMAFAGTEQARYSFEQTEQMDSMVKVLGRMERIFLSVVGGLCALEITHGFKLERISAGMLCVGIGLMAGVLGYFAGKEAGDRICVLIERAAAGAKELGKSAFHAESGSRGSMRAKKQVEASLDA